MTYRLHTLVALLIGILNLGCQSTKTDAMAVPAVSESSGGFFATADAAARMQAYDVALSLALANGAGATAATNATVGDGIMFRELPADKFRTTDLTSSGAPAITLKAYAIIENGEISGVATYAKLGNGWTFWRAEQRPDLIAAYRTAKKSGVPLNQLEIIHVTGAPSEKSGEYLIRTNTTAPTTMSDRYLVPDGETAHLRFLDKNQTLGAMGI